MGDRLKDRVAVITGGTSGIGEATVELFQTEGAKVLAVGRSVEKGEALARRLGPAVAFCRADVSREEDIKAAIDFAVSKFGRIDILFNNAGGPTGGGIEDVTQEHFKHAMDLLLGSVIFGMKHAVPHMKAQRFGRIINNSSIAALRTHMGGYLYSAAKAGVTQVSKLAGMYLGPHNITVNTISPGGIATPIFFGGSEVSRALDPEHEAAKMRKLNANLAKATPLHRAGQPLDIAYGALYLASDDGAYVNCHDLVIDAGMTAGGRSDYGASS